MCSSDLLFELASLYRDKKEFAKSSAQAEKILRAYPNSVYAERVKDLLDRNDCDEGLAAKGEEQLHLLERCLWRAPSKQWAELEPQAETLYSRLQTSKDPLFEPFVAELIQSMPAGTALRQRIGKEIPDEKLEQLASPARFHTKTAPAPGVKPAYPDQDLFDSGLKAALKQDWREANAIFRRFSISFASSLCWSWSGEAVETRIGNGQSPRSVRTTRPRSSGRGPYNRPE